MDEPQELICWNCAKRTIPGTCTHCSVDVVSPFEVFEETEKKKKNIVEIRKRGRSILHLDLDELTTIVAQNFSIKQSLLVASPEYLVTNPGEELDHKFDLLVDGSSTLLEGLTPKLRKMKGPSDDLLIKYIYVEPVKTIEVRKNTILMFLTFISIFFAGLFNYTKYFEAQEKNLSGLKVFNTYIITDSLLSALGFACTLMFILIVKDFIQIYSARKQKDQRLSSYFLPVPPIFEIGTLGSFLHQRTIHQDRKSLFNTVFYGPVISWILSAVIIIISLQLTIDDPLASQSYATHSVVAQGALEPLGLRILAVLAKDLGIWGGDPSQSITDHYLLHPITIAGLAGLYLSGIALFPAAHLNGGYLIRAYFGKRAHMIISYVVIFLLIWVHWLIAIFLLFLNDRLGTPEVLNEESKLPRGARIKIIVCIVIAILSFPIGVF
ncbi:MAG: hypothetical protein ACXAD7_02095 [Candidatus Kariarchaeaceae archaeon]|jgi:hypothetical protein